MLGSEGGDSPFGRAGRDPRLLGRGLGPAAARRGGGVRQRQHPDGPARAGGVVRRGRGTMRHRCAGGGRSLGGPRPSPPTPRSADAVGRRPASATTSASIGPAWSTTRCSAPAAAAKSGATSTRWQMMDRASSAATIAAAMSGRSLTIAHDVTGPSAGLDGGRLVEDRAEAGVGSAVGGLRRLGLHEGTRNDGLQDALEGRHLVGADHLEQAGPVDHRHLRPPGEEHLARAPSEILTDQVGAQGAEVLGSRDRAERESASTAGPPGLAGPLQRRGHHAGIGDGRHRVDRHARRGLAAELPGDGRHGSLGAAVPAGVGRTPSRAGRDPEYPTAARSGHQRQRGVEHVEIAPEMHAEECQPILFGTPCEVGLPGDAGDVDDGVQPAVLVHQRSEEVMERLAVGDRCRRRPGRSTGSDDATGRGLLRRGQRLGPVEGDEGIDGDDEPAVPAELFGDGRPDAASAAGHDADLLTRAHGAVARTSSSKPSR